eukprot:5073005-Amphidinium_carterae.1
MPARINAAACRTLLALLKLLSNELQGKDAPSDVHFAWLHRVGRPDCWLVAAGRTHSMLGFLTGGEFDWLPMPARVASLAQRQMHLSVQPCQNHVGNQQHFKLLHLLKS